MRRITCARNKGGGVGAWQVARLRHSDPCKRGQVTQPGSSQCTTNKPACPLCASHLDLAGCSPTNALSTQLYSLPLPARPPPALAPHAPLSAPCPPRPAHLHGVCRLGAGEWLARREQHVHEHAQRPPVHRLVVATPHHVLGRHVAGRAAGRGCGRGCGPGCRPRCMGRSVGGCVEVHAGEGTPSQGEVLPPAPHAPERVGARAGLHHLGEAEVTELGKALRTRTPRSDVSRQVSTSNWGQVRVACAYVPASKATVATGATVCEDLDTSLGPQDSSATSTRQSAWSGQHRAGAARGML